VLFKIDATPYEIAVAVAEANLEKTSQSIDASVSSITAAVARLNKTKVELERATKNWERVQKIIQQNAGALSVADQDRVETKYLESIEKVEASKAELAKQRKALGPTNADNPNLKSALSQFEKAQWDAENTVVRASADGVIESFNVEVGHFAAAGRPLISLVSNKTLWIQANFKENNISNMQIGDPAEIIFDISPGTVFKGNLSSIGYGVTTDRTNPGGLPQISSAQGWLRDPQRFPVIIDVEDETILKQLRQGSQVTVVVYTGDHPFLNALGRFRIRLLSKLSYIR
jgi:multidrug resistance efflux pump